jgi:hypothetical protein
MRILHIIGTLNPEAGGPTESVRVLLSYGPIGYTGEVVTLDDPSAPYLKEIRISRTRPGSDQHHLRLQCQAASLVDRESSSL